MAVHQIELTFPTYRRLARQANSFEDTPEDVIRRLLDDAEKIEQEVGQQASDDRHRAVPGSILPEQEYWLPVLQALVEAGGAARANDVIDRVGALVADRLTEADYESLKIGEVRWRNRVRFARLRMRERGLLKEDSPKGIWEITKEGRRYLNERPPQ
jgi:hypothetical protein